MSCSEMQFSVFQANSASRAYGYHNADYNKYTTHCTAAVARLRKSANLQQRTGTGKKRAYEKKEVTAAKQLDSRSGVLFM